MYHCWRQLYGALCPWFLVLSEVVDYSCLWLDDNRPG